MLRSAIEGLSSFFTVQSLSFKRQRHAVRTTDFARAFEVFKVRVGPPVAMSTLTGWIFCVLLTAAPLKDEVSRPFSSRVARRSSARR